MDGSAKLQVIVAMAWAGSQQVAWACEEPVFACEIAQSGKYVQVCQHADALRYVFGRKGGEPELTLLQPITQVHIEPWNGMGMRYWSSLEMRNGAWSYRMAVSYLRGGPQDDDVQASLTVLRQGQPVRVLTCQPHTVRERIESVVHP